MKLRRILQSTVLGGMLFSMAATAQYIPNDNYFDHGGPDKWRFILAFPMVWAPEINLDIEAQGGNSQVTISFKEIVERLQMGMMGEAYLQKKWWTLYSKFMYMDVAVDKIEQSLGGGAVGINLEIEPELKMGLYDFGMMWQVWRNLRIVTLGRLTQVEVNVGVKGNYGVDIPLPPALGGPIQGGDAFEESIDITPDDAWDYNLGLDYTWWTGRTKRHGFYAYGDFRVAGDSDSAWQVNARYMYRVSNLNNFWLGYKYYETKTAEDDEGDQTTITIAGPEVGWAFSF